MVDKGGYLVDLVIFTWLLLALSSAEPACDSRVYCGGDLVDTVQRAGIFQDSKTFVDMPQKKSTEAILEHFDALKQMGSLNASLIRQFVNEHFSAAGSDLEHWVPPDWTDRPAILERIEDDQLKKFAGELNRLWKSLGRKVTTSVKTQPERHSLLYLSNGFIVPGDGYREVYYWDSYWIVGGLLLSDMRETARGVLQNLLGLAERYGHVPNGGRVYYTRRGQPPLLAPMVDLYLKHTRDWDFVRTALPALEKEAAFWRGQRSVEIQIRGEKHSLAHYDADLDTPRPEGYSQDLHLTKGMSDEEAKRTYSQVASACESGWDFSSRWLGDMKTMSTIKTSSIIPVDLNVFLCWTDQLLAKYHRHFGNDTAERLYTSRVNNRRAAIHDAMWSEQEGAWFDYDMESGRQRRTFYPTNVFPLLADCTTIDFSDEGNALKIINYLSRHDLTSFPGGIPTSLIPSGQEWDLPNSLPPLQHFVIEAISNIPHYEAQNLSKTLSKIWLKSVLQSYDADHQMYDKFNAKELGSGGEYKVQTGFGWSNGAVLMLLNKYPELALTEKYSVPSEVIAIVVIILLIAAALLLATIFYYKRRRQLAPPYSMVQT